jgi:imidazolonepropionase-like amidohydrolase
MRFLLCILSLVMVSSLQAEPIAFRHARLVDGSGGKPLEKATLIIDEGVITTVGPDAEIKIPANAQVIDLSGKTLLPGLIANHSHVGMVDGTSTGSKNYTRDNIARQLQQYQRYGITTVTALGLNAPLFYKLREEAHAGTLPGADLFGADRGIGVAKGAPPITVNDDQLYRPETPEQARQAVDEMADRKTDLIKIWVDDFRKAVPEKMKPEIYKVVIEQAHKRGIRVASHVYYLEDAKALVAAGVDIIAHGVRDRHVDEAFIKSMKETKTWYIATLNLDESFYLYAQQLDWMKSPFFRDALQPALAQQFDDADWRKKIVGNSDKLKIDQESLRVNQRNLARLNDAGVKIGFGTDSGANPLRIPGFAEHRELELMVEAGIPPLQALTIATGRAADLLQLTDRGLLAPGKRADLLIVTGNPTQNILDLQQIDSVWQRGKKVK